jgi:two-component system response regulator
MRNDNKIYIWQNSKDRREKIIDGIMVEDSDRRQKDDPNYKGPERRSGEDRRSVKDGKIVMLVTDNSDDEELVLGAFQKNDIVNKVVVARDGAEALDYLFCSGNYAGRDASKMPHVILLDLNLQKIDSLEVLRRLHNDERTTRLPLVTLTSPEDDRNLTDYYQLRVNSFIRKPADPAQFDEIIRQLAQYWMVLNESPPPEKEFRNKPIRVLIVEDSDDDVLLLVRQLKKDGYRPIYDQVYAAEAMRKALENQIWDVILCDNSMPGFSAYDALDIYKENRLDLPFIIVTGAIAYKNAAEILRAGAHDYILKNDLAQLTPAIDRAFSMLKNRQEQ